MGVGRGVWKLYPLSLGCGSSNVYIKSPYHLYMPGDVYEETETTSFNQVLVNNCKY